MSSANTISLNPQQEAAMVDFNHCAVVACPGSGKTRLLVEKVIYILDSMPEVLIVLVTFTNDAAREIKARLASKLSPDALNNQVMVGTFHKLSMIQLQRAAIATRLVSPERQKELMNQAIDMVISKVKRVDVMALEQAVQASRSGRCHPLQSDETDLIAEYYGDLLKEDNGIDFSDILRLSVEGMKSGRVSPLPADFLFVDEFQDTDAVQFEWTMAHYNAGSTVNVVGDDDQSIYSFRESLGFHGIQDFLNVTGAHCHRLTVNYRSHAEIVNLASSVIARNRARIEKDIHAYRGLGGAVSLMQVDGDDTAQYHEVAALICAQLQNSPPRHGQWAILARGNFALNKLNTVFRSYNLPTYMPSGKTIWDSPAGRCLILVLKAILSEEAHQLSCLTKWSQLGSRDIETLASSRYGCLLDHAIPDPARQMSKRGGMVVDGLRQRSGVWRRSFRSRDDEAIKKSLIAVACYLSEILPPPPEMDEEKAETLDDMVMKAAKQLGKLKGTLKQRINTIERSEAPEEINAVYLTSMHGSKGLEWDNVVIIGATKTAIPPKQSANTLNALEEERRLWYVAMTRAKNHLYIAWNGEPSMFVKELLPENTA